MVARLDRRSPAAAIAAICLPRAAGIVTALDLLQNESAIGRFFEDVSRPGMRRAKATLCDRNDARGSSEVRERTRSGCSVPMICAIMLPMGRPTTCARGSAQNVNSMYSPAYKTNGLTYFLKRD